MKKITKIIALLLAMVTLLSVMCVPAFAEYSYPMSVTIYYKDEAGNNLKSALSTSINAAATTKPTWTSPSISGYALKNDSDSVVTYDMLDKSFPASNYIRNGSATYTVVYVKTYSHTINYLRGDSHSPIASSSRITGKPGTVRTVTSPSISGMSPSKTTYNVTIGNSDTSETIYYYPLTYTISYNANGGSNAPSSQTKTHGVDISITNVKPTRSGYTFIGWSRSASSQTLAYSSGDRYSTDASITLYAVWNVKKYTVTFDANGGSGAPSSLTKIHGASLVLPTTKPTRSGYNFLGWSTNSSATSATYTAGGNYNLNADRTLYAVWAKIPEQYTVYFNGNGGTGAPASQTKIENVTLMLSSVSPSRTGYMFMGWATSASSETISYIPGGSYSQNASATLYAVWKPLTYTVKYNANGGSGAPSSQTKTYDVPLTLRTGMPYREYYKFLGWSISSTASTPDYAPGDTYTNEGNTTLFAVWEYINYDFSVSGLTVDPNESRQYDTVQVHFRLDSWDQKNAYSVIPVEVVLNGSTIYSTFVDFAIYGVNYVDFDLNVGALEGLQSITAYVNRGDYLNETRTNNNSTSTTFTVNKVVELSTSYVNPNAPFVEGNDVVTSFYVANSSPSAIVPNDNVDFTFEVYKLEGAREVIVHSDTWEDVVIPGNATNLVYFKWTVPDGSAGTHYWCRGYLNEDQTILEDNTDNNRTEFSRYSVTSEESQTPNTRYENQAPATYNPNVTAPSMQTGRATWNMWEYQGGTFVLKTYGIQISTGTPNLRPSDACTSATYTAGKWTMKAGYGVSLSFNPVMASIPGYAMPQGSAYTGIQSIYARLPEYRYSQNDGEYRTLQYANGAYRFVANSDADGNERIHFLPVYLKNGDYAVSVTVTQVWTPAGVITAVRNSTPIMINGTIYDDFYHGN